MAEVVRVVLLIALAAGRKHATEADLRAHLDRVRDRRGAPPVRRCFRLSSIACIISGIPASTNTFSIWKPGALEMGLSTSLAPRGVHAMRARADVRPSGP